jgi:hypothetical protein
MPTTQTFEIFLIVDSNGDGALGLGYDHATENYDNEVGGGSGRRIIKINAKVALPEDAEIDITVPDTAGDRIEAEVAE